MENYRKYFFYIFIIFITLFCVNIDAKAETLKPYLLHGINIDNSSSPIWYDWLGAGSRALDGSPVFGVSARRSNNVMYFWKFNNAISGNYDVTFTLQLITTMKDSVMSASINNIPCKGIKTGPIVDESSYHSPSISYTCSNIPISDNYLRISVDYSYTTEDTESIYYWISTPVLETNALSIINDKLDSNKQAINSNTDALNKQTDTLKDSDSSEATDDAGSFFSGFNTDTFGLTSIITAPLNLITSITSSTCSPVGLPVPFVDNMTLELPCLRGIYEQHFGSLLNIYQIITFGIVAYWVCVRIFALVKDFKNPEHDEIEVMDL